MEDIEAGLAALSQEIRERGIESVAIPALGKARRRKRVVIEPSASIFYPVIPAKAGIQRVENGACTTAASANVSAP